MSTEPVEGIEGTKAVKKVQISTTHQESGTSESENPLTGFSTLLPASSDKVTGQEAYRKKLAEFFPGGASPVSSNGLFGFNAAGLSANQRAELKEAIQSFLDEIYGPGVVTVTELDGMIGLDATNLTEKDLAALAALLLGRTDPGEVTVSQKSREAIRNDKGLMQVSQQYGSPIPGSLPSSNGRVLITAPAPNAGFRTPAEWTKLSALLSLTTSATMQEANVLTLDTMSELQKGATEENIKQMKENFQKMKEAAEKAATWGVFSKIVNYVMLALGSLLIITGVGAGLGASLLIGAIASIFFSEEIGKVIGPIINFLIEAGTEIANSLLDAFAAISGVDVTEAKAWVKEKEMIVGAVVIALVIALAFVTGAVSLVVNLVKYTATSVGKIIPQVIKEFFRKVSDTITTFLSKSGSYFTKLGGDIAEKLPQFLVKIFEFVQKIVAAYGTAANNTVMLTTAAYGFVYNYEQHTLTIEIGKGERIQISLETFINLVQQTYDLFSKELSKILDQMTSDVSNATSVLLQEGNSASAYKFRNA